MTYKLAFTGKRDWMSSPATPSTTRMPVQAAGASKMKFSSILRAHFLPDGGNRLNLYSQFIQNMLRAIKLVFINFGYQIAGMGVISFLLFLYCRLATEPFEAYRTINLILGMILAEAVMIWHLYRFDYIRRTPESYSVRSISILCLSLLTGISFMFFAYWLNDTLSLPDWMETEFKEIESYPAGILMVAVLGPVAEELLFRGAIQGELVKKYPPVLAILLSAMLFGIIHFNPAQVIFAFLYGLLLGWLYYQSGSLLLCILLHILNNSTSVFLDKTYPEAEALTDLISPAAVPILLVAALLLLGLGIALLRKKLTGKM